MRRFALVTTAVIAIFGMFTLKADAGKGWCRSDPVVSLNGVQIQVLVGIPIDSQADVIGPINVYFTAPRSSNMTLVSTDSGFNGYGETVTLLTNGDRINPDGSFTFTTKVSVPMRGNQFIPMQVSIIPATGGTVTAQGYTVGLEVTVTVTGSTIASATVQSGSVVPTTASASTTENIAASTATATNPPTATATTPPTATTEPTAIATVEPTLTAEPPAPIIEATETTVEENAPVEVVPADSESSSAAASTSEPIVTEVVEDDNSGEQLSAIDDAGTSDDSKDDN